MDVESTSCTVGQQRSRAADLSKSMCVTLFRRSFTPISWLSTSRQAVPAHQRSGSGRPDPGDHYRPATGEAAR